MSLGSPRVLSGRFPMRDRLDWSDLEVTGEGNLVGRLVDGLDVDSLENAGFATNGA